MSLSNQITWANKDMISKILADTFGEKSFSVYGIDLPRIEAYLPTELPTIEVTDRTVDRLFRLQDGSYTLVDFESKYKRRNKVKYMHYIARTLDHVITLAEKIRDEQQKAFVLAAICVANNKFITQRQSDRIEEVLRMTKVSRQIFDKWKADTLSYGNEQRAEGKILGAIETMRDDGKDEQAIVSRLTSKYDLSAKQAKRYLRMVTDRESA